MIENLHNRWDEIENDGSQLIKLRDAIDVIYSGFPDLKERYREIREQCANQLQHINYEEKEDITGGIGDTAPGELQSI